MPRKRRWLWVAFFVTGLVVVVGVAARRGLLRSVGGPVDGELGAIRDEWGQAVHARYAARLVAKSAREKQAADDAFDAR